MENVLTFVACLPLLAIAASLAIVLRKKYKIKSSWDNRGQDLIEYALFAAFLTIAAVAIVPGVAVDLVIIFTKVKLALDGSTTAEVAAAGSNPFLVNVVRIVSAFIVLTILGVIIWRRRKQYEADTKHD